MKNRVKILLANPLIWVLALLLLGFWQVAFLYSGLQWDMLDVHLPWLFYMSEVLQSGELHYWNPYQQLGYPFHADMMSTWYPPALLTARFVGFNLIVLQYYFLFHAGVAGLGMYRLCTHFGNEKKLAFMGAAAYMLCGMMVSNAQHLFVITSLAWIPFVLYYFLRIQARPNLLDGLKLGGVTALAVMGGYPFLTVVLLYFLLILLCVFLIKNLRERNRQSFQILAAYFLGAGVALLICLPMIISLIQVFPALERANPLSTEVATGFPYPLKAFCLNFIPFALANNWEFFEADISMINIYSGVAFLVFFIYGLYRKPTGLENGFLAFGIFCLLAAISRELPVMGWLVAHVPLISYFRFPALLRLFFIIGLIIFSLAGVRKFLMYFERDRKAALICTFPFFLVIVSVVLYSAGHVDFSAMQWSWKALTIHERMLLGGILQLFVLAALALLIWKGKDKALFLRNLVLLLVFDMVLSVQMNINFTVVDAVVDPIKTTRALEGITPKGFPIPKRSSMLKANNEGTGILGIWRNINVFTKEPATDGFSSFWLKDYLTLERDSILRSHVLDNPPAYLSAKIFSIADLNAHEEEGIVDKKDIYLQPSDYEKVKGAGMVHDAGDTVLFSAFGPNAFRMKVNSSGVQVLTLMQSNYPGWRVKVNGKESGWFRSNYLFMSMLVPEGNSEVDFYYENGPVRMAFLISMTTFFLVLGAVSIAKVREKRD